MGHSNDSWEYIRKLESEKTELQAQNERLVLALKEIEKEGYSRSEDGFVTCTKEGKIAHEALSTLRKSVGKV